MEYANGDLKDEYIEFSQSYEEHLMKNYEEYYKNYYGPKLIMAKLGDKDITESINELYGDKHNWNGKCVKINEIANEEDLEKEIYIEFRRQSGLSGGHLEKIIRKIRDYNDLHRPLVGSFPMFTEENIEEAKLNKYSFNKYI
jgi:hypothetical protein